VRHTTASVEFASTFLSSAGCRFSAGDYSLASNVLDDNVVHKDMVRDEIYNGIGEVCEYMRAVKQAWPEFFVRATDIAVAKDGTSLFAAFEGRAAEGMPLFKGVDRFIFSLDGQHDGEPRIKEVEVYRSNWKGAQGHAQRKAAFTELESHKSP
jgi:hypothetical protein